MATESFRFEPPDRLQAKVSLYSYRSTSLRSLSISALLSFLLTPKRIESISNFLTFEIRVDFEMLSWGEQVEEHVVLGTDP